jgi:hypothetical protein
MTAVDDLRGYGVAVEGAPPTAQVRVAGRSVPVVVEESDAAVTLRASIDAPGADRLPAELLAAAGMDRRGSALAGSRSLAGAAGPSIHDALFELAKSLVQMARLGEQWAAAGYQLDIPTAGGSPAGVVRPPATAPPVPRWWGSVLVDTPIVSGDEARTTVSTLRPGQWYAVLEERAGWLLVDDGGGVQGWLGATQLRRPS